MLTCPFGRGFVHPYTILTTDMLDFSLFFRCQVRTRTYEGQILFGFRSKLDLSSKNQAASPGLLQKLC